MFKKIYKNISDILHSTEPYEFQIRPSILRYYEVFGNKDFLKELDGCQYRFTINEKEFLIIRNKYDSKSIFYDKMLLENMTYHVFILPYGIIYRDVDIDTLYIIIHTMVKQIVNISYNMFKSNTTMRKYLDFMIDVITIQLLNRDLKSETYLSEKFSKEYIDKINRIDIDDLAGFYYSDITIERMKELKTFMEKFNESNKF